MTARRDRETIMALAHHVRPMLAGAVLAALAVPAAVDVPPVADTVPGFGAASWQMLFASAKTLRPIVDRFHAELKALPELRERIRNDGVLMMDKPSVESPQDFVLVEIVRWGKVV
jgi:tripartite-type tricarboxylate transporter receptor subunit TctC